jgi:hypothetical protein
MLGTLQIDIGGTRTEEVNIGFISMLTFRNETSIGDLSYDLWRVASRALK